MLRSKILFIGTMAVLTAAGPAPAGQEKAGKAPPAKKAGKTKFDYLKARKGHVTKLLKKGPSPQEFEPAQPPEGVKEIKYPSGKLELKAWYSVPPGKGKHPAVAFFHAGFAFDKSDWEAAAPLLKAGFVLMTPMLRGENGNPGDFELLHGEVDDARAAIAWLAKQPDVDRSKVYAFGHSSGGGIAALLSLFPDCGAKLTGASGGLYDEGICDAWEEYVRFDPKDPLERRLRVLAPNVAQIKVPHIAYLGKKDIGFKENAEIAEKDAKEAKAPLKVVWLEGDHSTSLGPAMAAFIEEIRGKPAGGGKKAGPLPANIRKASDLTEVDRARLIAAAEEALASWVKENPADSEQISGAKVGAILFEDGSIHVVLVKDSGSKEPEGMHIGYFHVWLDRDFQVIRTQRGPDAVS
jgi:dienelactone hydrolase